MASINIKPQREEKPAWASERKENRELDGIDHEENEENEEMMMMMMMKIPLKSSGSGVLSWYSHDDQKMMMIILHLSRDRNREPSYSMTPRTLEIKKNSFHCAYGQVQKFTKMKGFTP